MTETEATDPRPTEPAAATGDSTIRPFRVSLPEEELVELRRRVAATRWPDRETVSHRDRAEDRRDLGPGGHHGVPEEVYRTPETWARRAYPNLIYCNEVDRGGHFAAWEEPELFAAELRAALRRSS